MFSPSGPTPDKHRRARFEADRAVLADRMPRVRHLILTGTDCALVEGIVEVDAGGGRFEPVKIEMRFDARYPRLPPRVWERGGRWRPCADRHMFPDGEFCLGLPGVDLPEVDTVEKFANFLDQLLIFLHDQFIYDADPKHRWPGRDWPHGYDAAYAQFAVETLGITTARQARGLSRALRGAEPLDRARCPCGSRFAYIRCHKQRVQRVRDVRRLRGVDDLGELMTARLDAMAAPAREISTSGHDAGEGRA